MNNNKRIVITTCLSLALVALAGCASDDVPAPIEGPITIIAGSPSEFRFDPDSFTVRAGQTVEIVLINNGVVEHEFAIKSLDLHVHAEPGETVTGSFTAPSSSVEFGCFIPGHYESGMKGQLRVV
jgi:uncharacterized cupredoxin-like copper-binding protein